MYCTGLSCARTIRPRIHLQHVDGPLAPVILHRICIAVAVWRLFRAREGRSAARGTSWQSCGAVSRLLCSCQVSARDRWADAGDLHCGLYSSPTSGPQTKTLSGPFCPNPRPSASVLRRGGFPGDHQAVELAFASAFPALAPMSSHAAAALIRSFLSGVDQI